MIGRFLLCVCFGASALAAAPALHLFNWADYMSEEVLEEFRKETGIEVRQNYFASNEELLAKLQAGAFAYDVVVPSDYYVKILAGQKLLAPLDHSRLSGLKHVDAKFVDQPYDRGNRYSVPYFWGTTGIGYNKTKVAGPVRSWNVLFDPRWKRKINMLDDMREVLGAALRLEGKSINERDPGAIRRAGAEAVRQKQIVRTYNSSTYREILNAGDVWLTQAFSGDIVMLRSENPDLAYVIPEEGGTIFTDNLVIPARSKNAAAAHRFIDFLLRPEIAAKLAAKLLFATPNREARRLLPARIRDDPAIYPPEEVLEKLEYVEDVGPALRVYEEVWIDLKTR